MAFGGAALLAGCSNGKNAITETVRPVTEKTGFSTTVPPAKDFVEATRADAPKDFIPVGVTPPTRTDKPLTPEQLKKAEAELAGTLKSHEQISGRPASASKPTDPKAAGTKGKPPLPKKQGEKSPASQ
ncbi:MAG: hypothetical protein U1E62_10680 [Alsobacter sp.]